MSRKQNNGKKLSAPHVKEKNVKISTAETDNFYHRAVSLFKAALILSVAIYVLSGTLAMGIIYHQHKGHFISWLSGEDSWSRKQAALQRQKDVEQAELEAGCQASYNMSCTQYTLAIGEATRANKRDPKQVAVLEKAKNRARVAM